MDLLLRFGIPSIVWLVNLMYHWILRTKLLTQIFSLILRDCIEGQLMLLACSLSSSMQLVSVCLTHQHSRTLWSLRKRPPEWFNKPLPRVIRSSESYRVLYTLINTDRPILMQLFSSCLELVAMSLQLTTVNNTLMINQFKILVNYTIDTMKLINKAFLRPKSKISLMMPNRSVTRWIFTRKLLFI